MKEKQKVISKKKTSKKPTVTIDMLQEMIKDIKNASMTLEKDGKSYKVRASKNLYYLRNGKKLPYVLGWDEIRKKSIHIENQKQLNDIVTEIKEYAQKA